MLITWFTCNNCSGQFTIDRIVDKGDELLCVMCDNAALIETLKTKYPDDWEEREEI